MKTRLPQTQPQPAPPAQRRAALAASDGRPAAQRQQHLRQLIQASPRQHGQRRLTQQLQGPAPIQRSIAVAGGSFDASAVASMIRHRFVVRPPNALEQVLTGYDFRGRRFVDLEALIEAVADDLEDYAVEHHLVDEGVAAWAPEAEQDVEQEPVGGYVHSAAGGSGYAALGAAEDASTAGFKRVGRKARYDAAKVSSTRRQEVAASGKGIAKSAAFIGLDAAVPGLGSGLSGANAANEVRKKHKVGKGKKELAKSAVVEGSAQALPYIAFARDLGSIMKSLFLPSKWRKQAKVKRARKWLERIEEQLPQAQATYDEIAAHADASDADNLRRLGKAIDRMQQARAEILAWVHTKQEHGTLPLTSGLEGYSSDEDT